MRDVITGSKLQFYIDRLETKKPITMEVFLTDFCDNDCVYCRYKHGEKYMSLEKFKEVVSRGMSLGVRGVILTGGGEPLLNPDFEDIVDFLNDNDIPFGVNTYLPRKFPVSRPRWVKVSYHNDKVLDHYEEFLEDLPEDVFVSIQKIYLKEGDLIDFYNKIKDIKRFNGIIIRPSGNRRFKYSQELLNSLTEEINLVDDERLILNYKWDFLNVTFPKCFANWSVLTVNVDGKVVYCCHKDDEVIGDISEHDILEKKIKHKTNMLKCDVPCRLSGSNYFLWRELDKLPLHIEFI